MACEVFIIDGKSDKYWLCSYWPILSSSSIPHCPLLCLCYRNSIILIKSTENSNPSHALLPVFFPAETVTIWDLTFSEVAFMAASGLTEVTFFTTGKVGLYILWGRNQAAFLGGNLLASFPHVKHNPSLLIVYLSDAVKHEFWLCHS